MGGFGLAVLPETEPCADGHWVSGPRTGALGECPQDWAILELLEKPLHPPMGADDPDCAHSPSGYI